MQGNDQRRAQRFDVEVNAEVYTANDVKTASTRNLSKSGVCLDLQEGLEEGIVVGISLFFTSDGIEDPDAEPLNVKAKVVWCTEREDEGFSAGANFEDLNEESATALEEFLQALE